jgi:hypothetical protein
MRVETIGGVDEQVKTPKTGTHRLCHPLDGVQIADITLDRHRLDTERVNILGGFFRSSGRNVEEDYYIGAGAG